MREGGAATRTVGHGLLVSSREDVALPDTTQDTTMINDLLWPVSKEEERGETMKHVAATSRSVV